VVLTAAHCVDQSVAMPQNITVTIGGRAHVTSTVYLHESWITDLSAGTDLATVVLSSPSSAAPVEIAAFEDVLLWERFDSVTIAGFGRTCDPIAGSYSHCGVVGEENSRSSGGLLMAEAVVTDRLNGDAFRVGVTGAACAGDSGGPALVKRADGSWRLVGVSSYNNRPDELLTACPPDDGYAGYVRVGDEPFRSWVLEAEIRWTNIEADSRTVRRNKLVGEFDGAPGADLLVAVPESSGSSARLIRYPSVRSVFGAPSVVATGLPASLLSANMTFVGDFNGDGRDDILVMANTSGSAVVYLSNANGFSAGVLWTAHATNGGRWVVGDFNGDGRDDILRRRNSGGGAEVLLSHGSGFGQPGLWTLHAFQADGWYAGDFNADGRTDILRSTTSKGGAEVLLSSGSGFGQPASWTTAAHNGRWWVGDFNGDGIDDLGRATRVDGGAEMLLSRGTKFMSPYVHTSYGHSGYGWFVGDFNGDRIDDLGRNSPARGGFDVVLDR
jgi:hypothetical protein